MGLYGVISLYSGYRCFMHTFIYFANRKLGHFESARMPIMYLILAIIFGFLFWLGYKYYYGHSLNTLSKALFYFPIVAILMYAIWAIFLVISSGGKWN